MEEHIDTGPETEEVHERPERWSVMCHVPAHCIKADETASYIHTEIHLAHNDLSGIITPRDAALIAAAPVMRDALLAIAATPMEGQGVLSGCRDAAEAALRALNPTCVLAHFGEHVTIGEEVTF